MIGPRIWPAEARFPLRYRDGSSDLSVYHQIFVEREYRCLDQVVDARLVIDCGANVGYSSVYFLSRFPNAKVIAIEPDAENYEVLKSNVTPYGGRVTTLLAGIWSRACGLKVQKTGFRDEKEWSVWVRECRDGESPDVDAVSIDRILAESGCDRISILKMDIERSEAEVFRTGYENWLSKCDAIVIELHDEECERIFFEAIRGDDFEVSRCGELAVCIRVSRHLSAVTR